MSYEIEYSKHAFKGVDHYNNEAFFTYVKTSSNNVSPRTPNPRFFAAGQAWNIIGEACHIGASVESGCWKPRNRWTSPESYIKAWRGKLKEALPFHFFVQENPSARIELAVVKGSFQTYLATVPAMDKYYWDKIKELTADIIPEDRKFFDQELLIYKVSLRTYADVEKAEELTHLIKKVNLLYWQSLELY